MRRARYMLVAVAAIVSLRGIPAGGAAALTVDASLTVSAELPGSAHQALVRETESIWRGAGVHIDWHADEGHAGASALRVFVVRQGERSGLDGAVGELVRSDSGSAIAFASIARAEGVVRAAGAGAAHAAPDALLQHRLGVVLGRAVAHEIGHYLLESSTHAGRGLMRATFPPREFVDLRSGGFDVDDASQRRIRGRWTPTLPLPPAAPTQTAHCCR